MPYTPAQRAIYNKMYKSARQEYKARWMAWDRGNGPHPTTGQWKESPFRVRGKFILCYWCLSSFNEREDKCPDCGTIRDLKKSEVAQKREAKGYIDIVSQNAVRAGKDPKVEMRNIRKIQRVEGITQTGAKDLNEKLRQFIKKHDKSESASTKVRNYYAKPIEKICVECGQLFTSVIRGNRWGGQVRCRICQAKREVQMKNAWQRKHYKKKK